MKEGIHPNYNQTYAPQLKIDSNIQSWRWFKTTQEAIKGTENYSRTWDNDYVLIGNSNISFVIRGGGCYDDLGAGVLNCYFNRGYGFYFLGFRSVIVI